MPERGLNHRKGDYGEELIDKRLAALGYDIYRPAMRDRPHPFDRVVIGRDSAMVVEIKTYARRRVYPDTGIEYRHYLSYRRARDILRLEIFLLFVDAALGKIYGNTLAVLEQPRDLPTERGLLHYPLHWRGDGRHIIFFPLVACNPIDNLTDPEIEYLRSLTPESD